MTVPYQVPTTAVATSRNETGTAHYLALPSLTLSNDEGQELFDPSCGRLVPWSSYRDQIVLSIKTYSREIEVSQRRPVPVCQIRLSVSTQRLIFALVLVP